MRMQRDMARLEAAQGQEFDLAFTESMPKHHSSAITMAKDEIRKGTNAGLKEIANNIVEKQTEERKKLLAMHESRQHDPSPEEPSNYWLSSRSFAFIRSISCCWLRTMP